MTKLGFEEAPLRDFKEAIHRPYGMCLVTGPTGSGKTTTLYSALSELNDIEVNISTAEDPVEFNLAGINQVQMHDDIGLNFAASLRSFLRQDPDIIMVGEIRDFETAEIAVKAALTGHMVLSTLHTNDAPSTVNRLLNMGVEPFLVCASVNLIVAQRLARRVCKDCKKPDTDVTIEALQDAGMPAPEAQEVQADAGQGLQDLLGDRLQGPRRALRGDAAQGRAQRSDLAGRVDDRAQERGHSSGHEHAAPLGPQQDQRGHDDARRDRAGHRQRLTRMAPDPDTLGDPTFHEVVFGEPGTEQQRYRFADFRQLSLRQRVKLLMSMPAQFLSSSGEEIPRDMAMRFRQAGGKQVEVGLPTVQAEDHVARLIRLLLESTLEHELRGCVKVAETLEVDDTEQRAALASGLLRTAKLLEDEHGSTPTSWAAIRRFATLVPTSRLTELGQFLQPGNEAETMQATAQALWHALSVDQDFGLGVLAVRTRTLLNKYLEPDWLCTAIARGLTTDLLLAYSVLTPASDEPGLRAIYARARNLGSGIPLEMARTEIMSALIHARANGRPIAVRLELLSELAGG